MYHRRDICFESSSLEVPRGEQELRNVLIDMEIVYDRVPRGKTGMIIGYTCYGDMGHVNKLQECGTA